MEDLASNSNLDQYSNQYVDAQNETGLIDPARLVWQQLIATTALKIRESLALPTILQTTADEVQQLLGCDRVLVYQFAPDWSGKVVVEAVSLPQWTLLDRMVRDTCFENFWLKPYQEKQFTAIADIANVTKLSPCYVGFLNQFQIKANLVVPILNKSQLWGLLISQSCTAPRQWLPAEVNGLQQISVHVGIAIHQADLLAELQAAKADLETQVEARTSELQKTNQQLLQSETRFLEISESSPSVIYIYVQRGDGSIYFEHISRAIEDLLGISVKQILENAMTLLDRTHPDDIADYLAAVQRSQETWQPFQHEWRMIATSGEIKWIKGSSRPKLRANGETAWHGVVIDISDRKNTELEIKEAQNFLNSIIENIPDMLFVKDAKNLEFVRFNKAGEELLGYSKEALIGKSDYDFFPRGEADFFIGKDQEVLQNKKIVDIPEELIQTKNQGKRILHTKKIPILDESGDPKYLLGISEDITERQQAKLALQESESRFQNIALSSPAGIYIVFRSLDGSFYFEYVSSAFENIFEVTVEQLLKDFNTYKNLIHPDDLAAYQEAITSSIENIYPFSHEWRIITPTKKLKWVQARSSLEIRGDATMAWYGVLLDIAIRNEL